MRKELFQKVPLALCVRMSEKVHGTNMDLLELQLYSNS